MGTTGLRRHGCLGRLGGAEQAPAFLAAQNKMVTSAEDLEPDQSRGITTATLQWVNLQEIGERWVFARKERPTHVPGRSDNVYAIYVQSQPSRGKFQ